MSLFSDLKHRSRAGGRAPEAHAAHAHAHALLDRRGLERQLLAMAGGDNPRPVFAAAFGIDRFDRVRAVAGHGAMGAIIELLAERLGAAEPAVRIAHICDDVLAVAFQAEDGAEAAARMEAARLAMQGPHEVIGHQIDLRLLVGLSEAGPPEALLSEADIALDAARAERVSLKVFDPRSHAAATGALSLMPELRAAIGTDRIFLVHQLQRDLRTGDVAGVECLVRWRHPRYDAVEPDVFVRLAEDTGDIDALTRWTLERALADQATLERRGWDLPMAVNLSGRLIGDNAFIDWVLGLPRLGDGMLRLEITETAVIEQPELAVANVARLAAGGVSLSIDDYGAGLSSLAYLKRLEADELKLDKSLVDDVSRSSRDAMITRSIVDLAHGLGMKVVAEGIEDAQTAALVAGLGCDVGQGYFFGRPVRIGELIANLGADRQAVLQQSRPRRTGTRIP